MATAEMSTSIATTDSYTGETNETNPLHSYSPAEIFKLCVASSLLIVGIVGNIISLVVFMQTKATNSFVVFLRSLCVFDLVSVVFDEVTWILKIYSQGQISISSLFGCDFSVIMNQYWRQVSSWLLIFITVERVIAVAFPFKAKSLCTAKKGIISVLVLVAVLLVITSFHVGTFHLGVTGCTVWEPRFAPVMEARVTVFLLLYSGIPTPLIVILNGILIYKLQRKQLVGVVSTSGSYGSASFQSSQRRLTIMALVLTFVFITCTFPYTVVLFITKVRPEYKLALPYYEFTKQLSTANHAVNCVLYCCTSRKFREGLRQLMRCKASVADLSTNNSGNEHVNAN